MRECEGRFESRWDEIERNADRRVRDAEATVEQRVQELIAKAHEARARAVEAAEVAGRRRMGLDGDKEADAGAVGAGQARVEETGPGDASGADAAARVVAAVGARAGPEAVLEAARSGDIRRVAAWAAGLSLENTWAELLLRNIVLTNHLFLPQNPRCPAPWRRPRVVL